MPDQEVVEELHKPIITKFEKKKSISTFWRQCLGCWNKQYAMNM